eukprot:m51a1_g4826 hypothetical protein (462) ;mRNA; r:173075-174460
MAELLAELVPVLLPYLGVRQLRRLSLASRQLRVACAPHVWAHLVLPSSQPAVALLLCRPPPSPVSHLELVPAVCHPPASPDAVSVLVASLGPALARVTVRGPSAQPSVLALPRSCELVVDSARTLEVSGETFCSLVLGLEGPGSGPLDCSSTTGFLPLDRRFLDSVVRLRVLRSDGDLLDSPYIGCSGYSLGAPPAPSWAALEELDVCGVVLSSEVVARLASSRASLRALRVHPQCAAALVALPMCASLVELALVAHGSAALELTAQCSHSIRTHCPRLRTLSLGHSVAAAPGSPEAIAALAQGLPGLETLRLVCWMPQDIAEHSALLRSVRSRGVRLVLAADHTVEGDCVREIHGTAYIGELLELFWGLEVRWGRNDAWCWYPELVSLLWRRMPRLRSVALAGLTNSLCAQLLDLVPKTLPCSVVAVALRYEAETIDSPRMRQLVCKTLREMPDADVTWW